MSPTDCFEVLAPSNQWSHKKSITFVLSKTNRRVVGMIRSLPNIPLYALGFFMAAFYTYFAIVSIQVVAAYLRIKLFIFSLRLTTT